MPFLFTTFPRADASIREARRVEGRVEGSPAERFREIVASLVPHQVQATKDQHQFTPAEWPPDAPTKQHHHILWVHFGVVDFDGVLEDDLAQILASIDGRMPYLFASSWSHGDIGKIAHDVWRRPELAPDPSAVYRVAWAGYDAVPLVRGRLVFPFSRPVPGRDWYRVWPHIKSMFEIGRAKVDPGICAPGFAYYFPAHPVDPPKPPICISNFDGIPFDVDWAMSQPTLASAFADRLRDQIAHVKGPQSGAYEITRHELREILRKKRGSKSPFWREVCDTLKAVVEGESFAESGERDSRLYRACKAIMREQPFASPESVAKLFAPSFSVMGVDGPTIDSAMEKLRRVAQSERELLEHDRSSRILLCFRGDRHTAYSFDEIAAAEKAIGTSIKNRWVLQYRRAFYFLVGRPNADGVCDRWIYEGPFTIDEAANAARTYLAPAVSFGVLLDRTDKTLRAKTASELVKDYGTVIRNVCVDLSIPYSYYNAEEDALFEAPCPQRSIIPKYHPEIDQWLRHLAGSQHPRLNTWLASVPNLKRPATVLYLDGPPETGKSLLASGISRLWSVHGPSSLAEGLSDFNDSILQNPLVLADEVPPKDSRGRARTGEIREFVQAHTRSLRRKNLPVSRLLGCVRVIFAANNREMLTTDEHLTVNDVKAIVDRFFYVPTQPEATEYLKQIRERDPNIFRDRWIDGDMIAEHVLYLQQTVQVPEHERFVGSGAASELTRTLTTSSGMRSHICDWLVGFLRDPSRLAQRGTVRGLVRVHQGRLAVNARVFVEAWDVYVTNTQAQPARRVATAVAGLSIGERVHLREADGSQTWFRLIDTENLAAWAKDAYDMSIEEIERRIHALGAQQTSTPFLGMTVN